MGEKYMDYNNMLTYGIATVETVCICMGMYHLIRGLKTKDYGYAWIYVAVYLVLTFTRRYML